MAVFEYSPIDLEGPAFRLVRILAADLFSDIQCELFEAWYTECNGGMPYEALSYTWGGTEKTAKISVNGSEMYITKNLYEALQHLRFPDRDRILWVDAICIDQNNNKERGHQVQQMSNIYREADRVTVWLGLGTLETDLVMDYMNQQHKNVVQVGGSLKHSDNQSRLKTGLERLLEHQWFTRIWVLQEIANARRASIVCGWKSVSTQTFAIVPPLLGVKASKQCRAVLDIMPGGSRNHSWWSKGRTLHTLLKRFRTSQATEQRDLIYALLNMSSDACGGKILVPDYTKELKKVVQETTSFLLSPESPTTLLYNYIQWTWEEFWQNLERLSSAVLVYAVRERDLDGIEILLKRDDCNISWQNSTGQDALHLAAEQGHAALLKLLLETGKVDLDSEDDSGRTPLSWAAEKGHEAIVKLLLETGEVYLDSKDGFGQTPLSWAAGNGHEAVVNLLLETGKVDLDSEDDSGRTSLSWAAWNGHEAIVKLLVETGKVYLDSRDRYFGRTPLSWAAGNGHEAVVKLLLETGKVDLNSRGASFRTPLLWAAGNGHEAVVKLLLETGKVDLDSKDRSDRTPLSWAVGNGHEAIVKLLVETGKVDLESKDHRFGQTPLSWAARIGHEAVVKLLVETGKVDLDSRDASGRTPLSWAAEKGHEAVVKLLLETGEVYLDSEDGSGRTPLSWAAENGHNVVVKLLRPSTK